MYKVDYALIHVHIGINNFLIFGQVLLFNRLTVNYQLINDY